MPEKALMKACGCSVTVRVKGALVQLPKRGVTVYRIFQNEMWFEQHRQRIPFQPEPSTDIEFLME
jgi:hypothetical protein